MSIPTLIVFKDGEAVEQFVGVQKKEDLMKAIDSYL
jgi:thioredoxin-like negative regulator of GroEL